jgi:hypothetical protein
VSKPQVIDDQEHERAFDRVAAADVAKKDGMVCAPGDRTRPGPAPASPRCGVCRPR